MISIHIQERGWYSARKKKVGRLQGRAEVKYGTVNAAARTSAPTMTAGTIYDEDEFCAEVLLDLCFDRF